MRLIGIQTPLPHKMSQFFHLHTAEKVHSAAIGWPFMLGFFELLTAQGEAACYQISLDLVGIFKSSLSNEPCF